MYKLLNYKSNMFFLSVFTLPQFSYTVLCQIEWGCLFTVYSSVFSWPDFHCYYIFDSNLNWMWAVVPLTWRVVFPLFQLILKLKGLLLVSWSCMTWTFQGFVCVFRPGKAINVYSRTFIDVVMLCSKTFHWKDIEFEE